MPQQVISVTAYFFDDKEVGKEEFPKGTNLDHIMSKMVQKYGQVSSFRIYVPPVFEEINKRS